MTASLLGHPPTPPSPPSPPPSSPGYGTPEDRGEPGSDHPDPAGRGGPEAGPGDGDGLRGGDPPAGGRDRRAQVTEGGTVAAHQQGLFNLPLNVAVLFWGFLSFLSLIFIFRRTEMS